MILKNVFPGLGQSPSFDWRMALLTVFLGILYFGSRKVLKKGISPILLILISAASGLLLYAAT